MESNVLMSECFSSSEKRHYFLDFKKTSSDGRFIQITRSDQQPDGSFRRSFVIVFEEDFHFLVSAMSSLFHHSAHIPSGGKTIHGDHRENRPVRESGIPSWAPELRPREKLMAHGAGSLSDGELLALMIGSGSPGEDAVALSGRLLKAFDGFAGFSGHGISSLCRFNGVGQAKAATLLALAEIVNRSAVK